MAPNFRLDSYIAQRCLDTGFGAPSGQRLDSGEAMTFARQLLKVRSRAFETLFPEYLAMTFGSRNTDVDDTDEAYTYQTYTEVGDGAQLMSDYSETAPAAEVFGTEATPQKIKPIVASYTYTFMDAKRSAKLGTDLPFRKSRACRRQIAQELDRVLTFGDTTKTGVTLYGLLNLPGTATYSTPNGVSGFKDWPRKTSMEVITDMATMIIQVTVDSNDIEHPKRLLLPLSRYEYIKMTPMGDGMGTISILNYFKQSYPEVEVRPWFKLESSSLWTGKRMMAYDPSEEKLDMLVPVIFDQLTPDVTALKTRTVCHARVGGWNLYFPKSVIYGDQI